MMEECIDMLYQIVESAKRCALKRRRSAIQGKAADSHGHTAAAATIQAALHEERTAELTAKAEALKNSAEIEVPEATSLRQEAKAEADKAALAREAACVATWQGAAARQACESEMKDMEGAMMTLSREQDAFQAMMAALGVAVASATLRQQAVGLDKQNAKAAGRARAADAQAEATALLAADMQHLAVGLANQGKEQSAVLAERQQALLEREAAAAADMATVHFADAAVLRAKATVVAEQAVAGEGQLEASVEAHMQLQQLAGTLHGLRLQQEAAENARADTSTCAAMQKEQLALAEVAEAKAAGLEAEVKVLSAQGRVDEACSVAELAAKWRVQAEAAQCNADQHCAAAQKAVQAAKSAEGCVHTLEQTAQEMQVRC
jgi:hypothetical protein